MGPHVRLVESNVSGISFRRYIPVSTGSIFPYINLTKPILNLNTPQTISILLNVSPPLSLIYRREPPPPSISKMIFNATISSWDGTPLTPLEPRTKRLQFTQQSPFNETIKNTPITHSPKSKSDPTPPQLYCDYLPSPAYQRRSKPNSVSPPPH